MRKQPANAPGIVHAIERPDRPDMDVIANTNKAIEDYTGHRFIALPAIGGMSDNWWQVLDQEAQPNNQVVCVAPKGNAQAIAKALCAQQFQL